MYYSIGNGGPYGNIGEFNVYDTYWSSSEIDNNVWYVSFSIGSININNKDVTYSLRPIRAFGNWTMGCMDSLACNYNPDANMADGSCEYANEGYDCEGNINVQVGDEAFGGIVFYLDETGQYGLVAGTQVVTIISICRLQWN